jgi:hypothetical protein
MILSQKMLAKLFHSNVKEINNFCKKLLNRKIQYKFLKRNERDAIVIKILQRIFEDKQIINTPKRKRVWSKGWKEVLQSYHKNKNLKSLIPKFYTHRENKIFRLRGQFIKVNNSSFEIYMVNIFRHWYFKRYFSSVNNIYEFGAGTGHNLVELSNIFPKKKLYGSDFVRSSVNLLKLISLKKKINLQAFMFNMLNPNTKFKILNKSGIFTSGAIEQLGGDISKFINYLINQKPEVIVHVEPTAYFYKLDKLPDILGKIFQTKRGYSSNLLTFLKRLESEKKIKILKTFRSPFGSLMMEGYDFIAWKPINYDF